MQDVIRSEELVPLPSKTITAGGNVSIELEGIVNSDARIAGFLLEINGTGKTGSSTMAVKPHNLAGLLDKIDIDSPWCFTHVTGRFLWQLQYQMTGLNPDGVDSVTCDSSSGGACRGFVYLPFADGEAANPYDTAIPAKLLRGKTLDVSFKSALTLGVSTEVTMQAGTILRPTAILVPPATKPKLPTRWRMSYEDTANLSYHLTKDGDFSHLFIYGDAVDTGTYQMTDTLIAQVTMRAKGATILDRALTQHVLAKWNMRRAKDAAQALSVTAAANLPFIPLISAPSKYKSTQLVRSGGDLQIDLDSGTATTIRYGYRCLLETPQELQREGCTILGYDPDKTLFTPDASKGLSGHPSEVQHQALLLPKTLNKA